MGKLIVERALIIAALLLFVTAFSPALDNQINCCKNLNESVEEPIYKEINVKSNPSEKIEYNKIIEKGLRQLEEWKQMECKLGYSIHNQETYKPLLIRLQDLYEIHPQVDFASLIEDSITLKFIDGYHVLLINLYQSVSNDFSTDNFNNRLGCFALSSFFDIFLQKSFKQTSGKAIVLHPFEYQAAEVVDSDFIAKAVMLRWHLKRAGFTVVYKENEEVNISYLKSNLAADVVFNFGHGGYADLDGDFRRDTVVLSSGEPWTDNTPDKYSFEYNQGWIRDVMDSTDLKHWVGYTPDFIIYYYKDSFPDDSLVFMATCDSLKDCSMAKAFVEDAGASTYIGWTGSSSGWPNALYSHRVINYLCKGWSVDQICNKIRYGCLKHWIIRCKLTYYGDGDLTIV